MNRLELLIVVMVFFSVLLIGGGILFAFLLRKRELRDRLEERTPQPGTAQAEEDASALTQAVAGVGEMVGGGKSSADLQHRMMRAGVHNPLAVPLYMGSKIVLGLGALFVLIPLALFLEFSPALEILGVLMGSTVLFFIPNIVLSQMCSRRAETVRMHLPDLIDLLEVCVTGGMGLDMAWNSVAGEIRAVCPLLADEMALTTMEMHLGESRGTAIRHMADRTGSDELQSLVAVLVQSERFGTSVSEALRTYAETLREMRSAKAEEEAEKMAVKMLFPMVVFIFPVVILVAVGPAGITLYNVLGGSP